MLQLFRRNMMVNHLLLLPYIFILHGGRLIINYDQKPLEHSWLFNQMSAFLQINSNQAHYISLLLIFVQAILINTIVNNNKVNPEGQLFPGLIFIILTGFHPLLFEFTSVLIANLFFILALQSMISSYLMKNASLPLFNFGFFIAMSSIFYAPYVWMILLGVFGLILFRGFSVQGFLQLLTGLVVVLFLLSFFLYWNKSIDVFYKDQINDFFNPYIFSMSFASKGLIALYLIMGLFIVAFIRFNILQIKSGIALQKIYNFLFWTSLFSLFSAFFCKITSISHLLILITPLCVFLSIILARIKNQLLAETIHLFFALFALFLQLQNW